MPTTQSPIPSVFLDGMFVEVQYDVAASADGGPAPIYTDFTTDKTTYVQGDLAQVTGAPAGSSIEIYSLDNFDAPGEPEHVYATQLDNTGGTTIDINTLTPGRYALVNTFDPGACNQYSLQDCEARTDFLPNGCGFFTGPPRPPTEPPAVPPPVFPARTSGSSLGGGTRGASGGRAADCPRAGSTGKAARCRTC